MEIKNTDKSSFTGRPALRFRDWELNSLVDYIVETHHNYMRKTIPLVSRYMQEAINEEEKFHPELLSIDRLFNEMSTELISHLKEEEQIIFPFIKKYFSSPAFEQKFDKEQLEKIHSIVNRMEKEHDTFGRKMDMIRIASENYRLPPGASASLFNLFNLLKEFENDFFIHLHLETRILFPKISDATLSL